MKSTKMQPCTFYCTENDTFIRFRFIRGKNGSFSALRTADIYVIDTTSVMIMIRAKMDFFVIKNEIETMIVVPVDTVDNNPIPNFCKVLWDGSKDLLDDLLVLAYDHRLHEDVIR